MAAHGVYVIPATFPPPNHLASADIVGELRDLGIGCDYTFYTPNGPAPLQLNQVFWPDHHNVEVTFVVRGIMRPDRMPVVVTICAHLKDEAEQCLVPRMIVEQLLREWPELIAENL